MMTVQQIFDLGVKLGTEHDPRGKKAVEKHLEREKKAYGKLKLEDKEYFDIDRLKNPYADCGIHVNDGKTQVKRVLAGIDINTSELLLAKQLSDSGKKIDLVITHHPVGKALSNLHEVMGMTVEVYEQMGVPVHIAEKMFEERIRDVGRNVHPANHFAAVDSARLLGLNFMSTHTITDNMVNNYLIKLFEKKNPHYISDILEILLGEEEFKIGKKQGVAPKIVAGGPHHRVGKWYVEMTGGTNPSSKVYQPLSNYGVSTVIGMHMKEDAIQKASETNLNVVITGHMPSDSLGMNLWLDELEKQGVEVIPCGGLIRVSRNKGKKK